jgi:hypothetical protein
VGCAGLRDARPFEHSAQGFGGDFVGVSHF